MMAKKLKAGWPAKGRRAGADLLTLLALLMVATGGAQAASHQADCTIESLQPLFQQDLSSDAVTIQTMDLDGHSSEGGEAKVFRREGRVVSIEVVLAGETGRLEIRYLFGESLTAPFLVEITEVNYRVPLGHDDSVEMAATVTTTFPACGPQTLNFPNGAGLKADHDLALEVLAEVLGER